METLMTSVLLMDDDIAFAFALTRTLRGHGYDVDTVDNASDAMEHIEAKDYAVLLTDIIIKIDGHFVPDGGLSLIHRLRARETEMSGQRPLPIIAMSGTTKYPGMQNILNIAQSLGASAIIEKPAAHQSYLDLIKDLT
ncbi:MAG: response regulator [Roseobacter sp.]